MNQILLFMLREQRASEITSGQLFACTNHPVPTPWLDWPCGDQRVSRVAHRREKAPWLCQQMPPRTRPRTPMLAWPCGGHLAQCPPTAAEGGTGGVRSDRQPWRSSPLGGVGGWGPENKTRSLVALLQGGALGLSSQVLKRLRS